MKKTSLLALLYMICVAATSYGQNTENKDFLKNYKAPDFKQRRFDVRLNGDGRSSAYPSAEPFNHYSNLTSLSYTQYSNSQRYQGFLTAGISEVLSGVHESGTDKFNLSGETDFSSKNYFYVRPKFFIGVHGATYYRYYLNRINKSFDYNKHNLLSAAALSVGFGRLEPVHYARNAMDIQRLLMRGGRIKEFYTEKELTILSDEIARINNVRFYDFRLRRIEQFEALDKTIRGLGNVTEYDIAYFSYLADAYLYAQNFTRYSGFRHEFGIGETVDWSRIRGQYTGITISGEASTSLFYRGSMHIPTSYTVQHEIEVLTNVSYIYYPSMPISPGEFGGFASSRYTLGFYPTTRTNFNVGAQAGACITSSTGYSAGLFANTTYYISPQFRISGALSGSYTDNYAYNTFSGIWGDYGPTIGDGYSVWGTITLNYAIF